MIQAAYRCVIVTGSSREIGAALEKRLARDGIGSVVNYAGRAAVAEYVVRDIESAGGRAIAVNADVTSAAAVAELFDSAGAKLLHLPPHTGPEPDRLGVRQIQATAPQPRDLQSRGTRSNHPPWIHHRQRNPLLRSRRLPNARK